MRMDPDDESDDMGRFDSDPGDLENGALEGADGDSDSCDDSEEHQGPDSAEPEAPPPSLNLAVMMMTQHLFWVDPLRRVDWMMLLVMILILGVSRPLKVSLTRDLWAQSLIQQKMSPGPLGSVMVLPENGKTWRGSTKQKAKIGLLFGMGNGPSSAFPRLPPMPQSGDEDDQGTTPAKRGRDYLNVPPI